MQSQTMRAARSIAAGFLMALMAAPVSAQVDFGATRGGGSILSPMAIECLVLSDGGRSEIHVRNSTDQTL